MELKHEEFAHQFDAEILPPATVLLNGQYVIERFLSSGGFGITYLARDSLDRRVVIKECYPEAFCSRIDGAVTARSRSHQGDFRSFVDMFVREAHNIAKLSHPNIVGVHQVFRDNETAYMALDLIEGEDLFDIIKSIDQQPAYRETKPVLLKLLDAISNIHDRDMLHRDISPDNILIDAWGEPTLIDFGAAREEASKKSRALSAVLVVKDGYSPQEFYISGSQQTSCSDLYALAATFFHFISREPPPNSQIRLAAIASNRPDPYTPLVGRIEGYPKDFLEAIDIAMSVFPQDRIQSAQDWILRIDEAKRKAAALANAQSDHEIEKTVIKLIENVAIETEEIKPIEAKKPEPVLEQKKKRPAALEYLISESQIDDLFVRHDLEPVREEVEESSAPWALLCDDDRDEEGYTYQQQETETLEVQRSLSRSLAWLVLLASLSLFVLDGHTVGLAEAFVPFVEQILSPSEQSIAAFEPSQ